jgi:DNA-binding CsgD family transcriptional regulator
MNWLSPILCDPPPPALTRDAIMEKAMADRERVRELRHSMTYNEMAAALGLSRTAVANHVRAIKEGA